jgi:predicted Zn-dependent protease
MIDKIKDQIPKNGFNDFQIARVTKHERQLYLVKNMVEAEREVSATQYEVTVYLDHSADGKNFRGAYTFFIKPGEDLEHYLTAARLGAVLVKNRPYGLVGPAIYPEVELLDPRLKVSHEPAENLVDIILRHANDDHVTLSSAEIFLTATEIELHTSTGIAAQKEKGRIEVDLILLSRSGDRSAEMHVNLERRNYDHLQLAETIERHKNYARDMLAVEVPRNGRATVVFNHDDIYNLFYPLIYHSSARIKDQGISAFAVGAAVADGKVNGEGLTILSSGLEPYGLHSDRFDEEGVPGQVHTVVENGIFMKYLANKQYADYLGLEPTGAFKNLIVKLIPAGRSDIPDDEYYEIVKFSDLFPDPVTSDFVAEIRFGYHHQLGRKTPIKGGSVSGNVFKALADLTGSQNEAFNGQYRGPEKIAIRNLDIAGS